MPQVLRLIISVEIPDGAPIAVNPTMPAVNVERVLPRDLPLEVAKAKELMEARGVRNADHFVAKYGAERCIEVCMYSDEEHAQPIRSKPAYINKALRYGWYAGKT